MTTNVKAGHLTLTLEESPHGIAVRQLSDTSTGTHFLTSDPLPLFTLSLREISSSEEIQLTAEAD